MQADTWNSTRTMNLRLYLCSKKRVDFENCHGWLTRWYAKSNSEGRVCDRRLLFCFSLWVFWIALKLWRGPLFELLLLFPRHSLLGVAVYLYISAWQPSLGFVSQGHYYHHDHGFGPGCHGTSGYRGTSEWGTAVFWGKWGAPKTQKIGPLFKNLYPSPEQKQGWYCWCFEIMQ